MDDNVLFKPGAQSDQNPPTDPVASGQDPAAPEEPIVETPSIEASLADSTTGDIGTVQEVPETVEQEAAVDPNADPNADPTVETETGIEETEAAPEEPPPPGGVIGFLKSSLFKKILIGLGVLILVIFLVTLFLPKGDAGKQVKLQWWGLWEEDKAVQALIIDFKKTHPNIDVEYVKKDPQEYRERLIARIENGSGPDVFRFHNTWLPMFSEALLPLSSDVITPEEYKKVYYPVMQEDLVKNGAIYGIPMMGDTLAMYVNPKLFEEAGEQVPTNWDDFIAVSKKLTKRDAKGKITTAGAGLGAYGNITHASDIISLLFVQQGIDMQKFTTDQTEKQRNALKYYTSFALGEQSVWQSTLDNSTLAFSRGNLAIYFGFSWDVFTIQRLNKDLKFQVHPVPGNQDERTTIASYWAEGVSAKSPNQKEALEFMKYLSLKETAEKFYTETAKTRAFGEPYARRDLRENLREEALVYPFVLQLDNAKSSFFASDTHDGDTGLNTLANTYLGTAINSIVEDNGSADSVIEPLNNGILQVFEQYAAQ